MKILLLIVPALALAGCGGSVPVETSKLNAPSKWLMASPCKGPRIPHDEANPSVRAVYYTESRKCSGRKSDQVRGLQRYIRAARGA